MFEIYGLVIPKLSKLSPVQNIPLKAPFELAQVEGLNALPLNTPSVGVNTFRGGEVNPLV